MCNAVSYRFSENTVFTTTVGINQDTEFILPSFCITLDRNNKASMIVAKNADVFTTLHKK